MSGHLWSRSRCCRSSQISSSDLNQPTCVILRSGQKANKPKKKKKKKKSETKVIFMTMLSLARDPEFLRRRRYDKCAHMSGRIGFPMSVLVCPHQPQEPLSSLKSMAERAALSSGMEGDVPSLHLASGNTHAHANTHTHVP